MVENGHIIIEQVIDDFLKERNKKKGYKAKSFWASSAGTCFRKRYFQRKNIKPSNPPNRSTFRKFYVGDLFHDAVQRIIKPKAKYFEVEKRVETDNLSGYIDIIARFNGKTTLYELKSVSDFYFRYLAAEKYGCSLFHMAQALTYYWLLKDKPDEVRVVYMGTSTLRIKECPVPITKKSLAWIKNDWKKCFKYWDKKKKPPMTKDKKQCSYCQYRSYCKKGGDL